MRVNSEFAIVAKEHQILPYVDDEKEVIEDIEKARADIMKMQNGEDLGRVISAEVITKEGSHLK